MGDEAQLRRRLHWYSEDGKQGRMMANLRYSSLVFTDRGHTVSGTKLTWSRKASSLYERCLTRLPTSGTLLLPEVEGCATANVTLSCI